TPGRDHFGIQRHIAVRHADTIEHQLHVALTPEMSWVLGRFQIPDKVDAARKRLLAEFRYRMQMTEYGVANRNAGGREVWFIQCALQKGTSGQDHLPRTGTQGQG